MSTSAFPLDEAAARRVLFLQAHESGATDNPLWTAEDRAWATRLARESTPVGAAPQQFLDQRARHALQRLAPRDAAAARRVARRGWRAAWVALALAVGLAAGVAVDAIGASQHINLLAPPVWAVIAWNLLVYLGLLVPLPHRARAWLAAWLAGRAGGSSVMGSFHAAWARHGARLLGARAALLMHAAALALALGLAGGMYLRGLGLDYRAGWQSTFLDAAQVHAVLATLLAPAVALTGIAVPDAAALQALRVMPGVAPVASAAPWIHLYATMLALFVVLPRGVLALWAAWRAARLAQRVALPLDELYFQRLLREQQGRAACVQVLPHGAAPSPHALACLQAVLTPSLGSGLQVSAASATAYGSEEAAAALAPPAGTTLRVALVDLAATPEDDTHGAFVGALRRAAPTVPLLVLADETAFRARFATLPARLAERRAAWQQWAKAQGVGLVCVDLAQPELAGVERALQSALQSALQA
ncbi:MAG: DUF2868 domain-containing protein [Rubrivivax sp.]|nr:DUF2868 domain-containing protein [Rubrivivax sp.]